MKMERKGNAKLKPKMAVNSANHRAARFRRQSTAAAAVVVLPAVFQQLVDAVRRHRQAVYDRLGPALP